MIEEKTEPLQNQIESMNLCSDEEDLDELEQYGRRLDAHL